MPPEQRPTRILTISGSLRGSSSNTSVLEAARHLAPPDIDVCSYRGLATLPAFNPDLSPADCPTVAVLEQAVRNANALWISCPEYAGGIPGALKNGLDWLVGTAHLSGKPVGIINTSPRATRAIDALRLVLETMDARCVDEACITLPLLGSGLDAIGIVQTPALGLKLQVAMSALAKRAVRG